MNKTYRTDVQLLTKILQNQVNIENAIKRFGCNEKNLENDTMVFDLCAFYMAQIGEEIKNLTDTTKKSLTFVDVNILRKFRNMIDHTYDKVNKSVLKAYIFLVISEKSKKEIKDRIMYCRQHAK